MGALVKNRVARVRIVSFPFFAKSLLDELFPCCSAESTEDLQALAVDDGRHVVELEAHDAK